MGKILCYQYLLRCSYNINFALRIPHGHNCATSNMAVSNKAGLLLKETSTAVTNCRLIIENIILTLSLLNFLKKCRFLPLNQFFGCNGSKLALILTKSDFPTLKVDFPKIRCKNVHLFNLVHAHKHKFFFLFAGPFRFFFLLFSFPFSLPFYYPYLLLFTSFFSAVKSLVCG